MPTAAAAMTAIASVTEPGEFVAPYADRYARFVDALIQRGYVAQEEACA